MKYTNLSQYCILVGFGLACAPVRCAHPSFWVHCHAKRGAARPPRPWQLRCFLVDPQKYLPSIELGPPTSRAFFFPCPRPAHRSFDDPSVNIFGVKLFFFFLQFLDLFFLLFSYFSSLLFNFFLFFSSYPSLLISSYSSRRCYSSSSYSSLLIF